MSHARMLLSSAQRTLQFIGEPCLVVFGSCSQCLIINFLIPHHRYGLRKKYSELQPAFAIDLTSEFKERLLRSMIESIRV